MITSLVRKLRRRPPRTFEYVPEGWQRARSDPKVKGWNVKSVFTAQLARWEKLRESIRAPHPWGVADNARVHSPHDVMHHNQAATFAYVLLCAAHRQRRVSLLDWGGGLGEFCLLAREILPPDVELDYHTKEVPAQLEIARRTVPEATLYDDDEQFAGRRFDLVLASGALQYVEDWRGVLARLAAATGRLLFITRLPVVLAGPSFVMLQRSYAYGYDTEYLSWCLRRDEFLTAAHLCGLSLVREFAVGETFDIKGAPAPYHGRGYLFRPE